MPARLKRPRQDLEHIEQAHLIQWADTVIADLHPNAGKLFAIPNGGHRNKHVALKLKEEGVRAGVLDLLFPEARGGYFGLWIEMKVRPNKPTPEQLALIRQHLADGYYAAVCYTAEQAQTLLLWYLELAPTPRHVAAMPPVLHEAAP